MSPSCETSWGEWDELGVPDVDEDITNRLTSLDVDDSNVHELREEVSLGLGGEAARRNTRRAVRAGPRPCFGEWGVQHRGSTVLG